MTRILGMNITQFWLVVFVGSISLMVEIAAMIWPNQLKLISPVMRQDGLKWLLWPAVFGALPGHFWSPKWLAFQWLKPYAPTLCVVVLAATVIYDFVGPKLTMEQAFLVVPTYYLLGAILWNQTL